MRHATSSSASPWTFATALFVGLVCGIACAMVIAALAMTLAMTTDDPIEPRDLLRLTLEAAVWAGAVAGTAAVFPIGPIAGVAGWLLYRRGVVAPWAYAAVGAVSAAAAVLISIAATTELMRYWQPNSYVIIDESVLVLFIAACAAVGAFSGLMAGRVIRRGSI